MHSHTDRRGQARWDRPQRVLQEKEVVEFHWKKLRRRNGGLKQDVESKLSSRLCQEQGEGMAQKERQDVPQKVRLTE